MQTAKGHLGSITFDGQTVTIEKKMRGATRIPVESVHSMSIERAGLGMKGIRFAVSGGTAAQSAVAGGNHKDLAEDPYGLTFRSKSLPEFEALIQQVEAVKQGA